MKYRFLVVGGDLRNVKLASILEKDGNKVSCFGLENSTEISENEKIEKATDLKSALDKADIIVGPVPFSKDGENLNASYSNENILLSDLITKSNKNKIFISGSIQDKIKKNLDENYLYVIDVMKREELAILNTIATAEGAIELAIKNTEKILQGTKVLILGFGRVAKILAIKFSLLSCSVTCSARKISDLAWIKAYGYSALNINEMLYDLKDFDVIINTVPQTIIKEKELKHMNPNVLLIDLASYPGGIDGKRAESMGLKFVWALALPGKVAPVSSAEFIKETIYNVLEEHKDNQ